MRHALRLLLRTPAFTTTAVLTLAVAVGATTAIFTIVDAVVLRPLAFPDADRLAVVRPSSGSRLAARYFSGWRGESRIFADMAAWVDVRVTLEGAGEPLEVDADRVT